MTLVYITVSAVALLIVAVVTVRAIGGNVELVKDWRRAWKFYTTWFFLMLGAMPDLYNAAAAAGLLDTVSAPQQLVWVIRGGALLGLLFRMIRQTQPVARPTTSEQQP